VPVLADLAAATGKHLQNAGAAAQFLKTGEEAAAAIVLPASKVASLAKIASAYGQLNLAAEADRVLAAALDFARGREDAREKATCLASAFAALEGLKQTDKAQAVLAEARQTAESIAADESRGYALLSVAQKCLAAGKKQIAGELLTQAQAAADKVTDSSARGPLVDDIARARKSL
jgi:hypothetical protein